jgi:hypothetical protein
MQTDSLLEQLDWFFTSPNWTLDYPFIEVFPMAKNTSDHVPCKVSVSTKIPKTCIFRFENFWIEHVGFFDTVCNIWHHLSNPLNSTRNISSKFKRLRAYSKSWSKSLSNLNILIANCDTIIAFLDSLEDQRILFNPEANLRALVKVQLATLLHYKNVYWRNRFTNNRVKLGDECTNFFHAMATISHRRNTISQILNDSGVWVQDHAGKEALLWAAFKSRLGVTLDSSMLFELENLITARDNLEHLVAPITREEIDNTVKRWPIDKAPGVDVKSAPHAKHTASRTKLAYTRCRIRSVPVNFPETDKG